MRFRSHLMGDFEIEFDHKKEEVLYDLGAP